MNWLNLLLATFIALAAGYFLEPDLRMTLTGEAPKKPKIVIKKEVAQEETPEPAPAPKPAPAPVPAPEPTPAPEPPPAPPVTPPVVDPAPEPPKVDPAPAEPKPEEPKPEEPKPAEPKPEEPKPEEPKPAEPAQEEATTAGKLTDEQIVKAMQSSFHSGKYKEFALDKAGAWKATGTQKVDGETYQTGTVDYSAESIFGVKVMQAKALIQDGVVVKWISPKDGMEIK